MQNIITKGEFKAIIDGNTSRVVRKDGLNVALMIRGEVHYCEEQLKNESWLEMRERTKPDRERDAKEVEANAEMIATAFNLAQIHSPETWQMKLDAYERMLEKLEEIKSKATIAANDNTMSVTSFSATFFIRLIDELIAAEALK